MREFGTDYLFRVSLEGEYKFQKVKPVYVVAANKTDAESYARRQVSDRFKITSVTILAEQYGGNFFSGNFKQKKAQK